MNSFVGITLQKFSLIRKIGGDELDRRAQSKEKRYTTVEVIAHLEKPSAGL